MLIRNKKACQMKTKIVTQKSEHFSKLISGYITLVSGGGWWTVGVHLVTKIRPAALLHHLLHHPIRLQVHPFLLFFICSSWHYVVVCVQVKNLYIFLMDFDEILMDFLGILWNFCSFDIWIGLLQKFMKHAEFLWVYIQISYTSLQLFFSRCVRLCDLWCAFYQRLYA